MDAIPKWNSKKEAQTGTNTGTLPHQDNKIANPDNNHPNRTIDTDPDHNKETNREVGKKKTPQTIGRKNPENKDHSQKEEVEEGDVCRIWTH